MSRTPPERTYEQQRTADRVSALKVGTPDALRAWAVRYSIPIVSPDDDEALLISIHEVRVELFHGAARAESRAWLVANKQRIVSERTTA